MTQDDDDNWQKAFDALSLDAQKIIHTSCAVIFLSGNDAYKLKKPVNFGFLDYSTHQKRLWALGRELAFNAPTAPLIYREVISLHNEPVLLMRRFDEDMVLSVLEEGDAAGLDRPHLDDYLHLGSTLAKVQSLQAACCDPLMAHNLDYVIGSNTENMRPFSDHLGSCDLEDYLTQVKAQANSLKDNISQRFKCGFVRRCHGDLHLGNILWEEKKFVFFDAIEFNDRLSLIDVGYDLAFLVMDLMFRGQKIKANRVLNGWLSHWTQISKQETYSLLRLFRLFLSVRAAVRCHVTAHCALGEGALAQMAIAKSYLTAAIGHLSHAQPKVMAIGGLSGAGKSYWSRKLAPHLDEHFGAVIIRSDEVRKNLFDCAYEDALPEAAYSSEVSQKVLEEMCLRADLCVKAGIGVVFDATFIALSWQEKVRDFAFERGLGFCGLFLECDDTVRLDQLKRRQNDVSDASETIARQQQQPEKLSKNWHFIKPGHININKYPFAFEHK